MASATPSYLNLAMLLGIPEAALENMLWDLRCDLRVGMPAVVVSFDAAKQTVEVQPAIRENLLQNSVPTPVNLPTLINVPVMLARGGGFSQTLPIQPGDECVVFFMDNCYDGWWQSGGTENNQVERRRHDLSDGIAYFGIWSQPRVLNNYSTTTMQLRSDDGNTVIELGAGEVTITALNVTIKGNVKIQGTLEVTGAASLVGKDFITHVHKGVTTGSGDTGPVGP